MTDTTESDFRSWACSLSGCDGGDPQAPIWLCGIEWGYGKEKGQTEVEYESAVREYYLTTLKEEISKGAYVPDTKYIWKEHNNYRFGVTAAKLFVAIHGFQVSEYSKLEELCPDARLFKLNLYPIPFRFTDDSLWHKYGLDSLTGLASKEVYRTWCFINRFPAICAEVSAHSPSLIVCTGVTYLVDFFTCFAGQSGTGRIQQFDIHPSSDLNRSPRRLYHAKINNGKTTLAVLPFFSGRYGLNSDYLVQAFGEKLGKLRG